ncbi:MAG: flagellar biosynthesis regulator FlaF [Proteobacteria bacterium]|nr:flagellar biosynthesis regulator FlaF [Pseudomonadota bacterium]
MTQAAQAYGAVARKVATPRETEADKLLFAAQQLAGVRDAWDSKKLELPAALLNNRKLWSVLIADVTSPDNPLPQELRQNVANIGIFVMKQTVAVMDDPKPEKLGSLININRELAAGLLGRA